MVVFLMLLFKSFPDFLDVIAPFLMVLLNNVVVAPAFALVVFGMALLVGDLLIFLTWGFKFIFRSLFDCLNCAVFGFFGVIFVCGKFLLLDFVFIVLVDGFLFNVVVVVLALLTVVLLFFSLLNDNFELFPFFAVSAPFEAFAGIKPVVFILKVGFLDRVFVETSFSGGGILFIILSYSSILSI